MVRIMDIYIDGGCRRNGYQGSFGAAAAVFAYQWEDNDVWTRALPAYQYPRPTNQRAEMTAVILALEIVLEKQRDLNPYVQLEVNIYSDSRYVIGCMTEWSYTWDRNGWVNAAGNAVVNRDLIEEAIELECRVRELGSLNYIWVPRNENAEADWYCNQEMDQMQEEEARRGRTWL